VFRFAGGSPTIPRNAGTPSAASFSETFPEAETKKFFGAVSRLWIRWLKSRPATEDSVALSVQAGRDVGNRLQEDYREGVAGGLAAFLLDRRVHLIRVRDFLDMRNELLSSIERLRRDPDPAAKERAEILNANFSSIVLRALHNAGPSYASEVISKLGGMIRDFDAAARNLAYAEPEAAAFLKNNRATILTRALHSGALDYGGRVAESLPSALRALDRKIGRLEASSPKEAEALRSNKRTVVYRALTNGHLNRLKT
jgi:hypothetical protein